MRAFDRELLADGRLKLHSRRCNYVFTRLGQDALLITVTGNDSGEFGTSIIDEVQRAFQPHRPLALFIDIQHAVGAATSVSDEWIRFLALHSRHFASIDVLVVSRVLELMVAVVQHFSRTGNLIRMHADAPSFHAMVEKAGHATRTDSAKRAHQ